MNNLINPQHPEAHATDLTVAFSSSVEYHLATLEQLLTRKSSSKSDILRQQKICDRLILTCFNLDIYPKGLRRMCTRLEEAFNELRNNPESLNDLRKKVLQCSTH